MKGLLVRVAADQSEIGGQYNSPMDSETKEFAYVAIPETQSVRSQYAKPYSLVEDAVKTFGRSIPNRLIDQYKSMHLDPDFEHLTYGDEKQRGKQITDYLKEDDLIVFYAGLQDIHNHRPLVYAIIGLYVIKEIVNAIDIPEPRWHENAHTRYRPDADNNDIVVRAKPNCSGRLQSCIPIGDYRKNAYRVRKDLLEVWGDISSEDGYIQRSARLPKLKDPEKFYDWFLKQNPVFLKRNN